MSIKYEYVVEAIRLILLLAKEFPEIKERIEHVISVVENGGPTDEDFAALRKDVDALNAQLDGLG